PRLRAGRAQRRRPQLVEAEELPRDDRERAAPSDRRLPRPDDRVMARCNDCTRTDLLRAAAGAGLPAIEPGMPAPAGTGLSRRSFLARSAGLALSVYGASKLPLFDEGIAFAASGPAQPVLVSVFLEGGADALSVLFPSGDPAYRKLRPHLALPDSAGTPFAEDDRLRWHPSAGGLVALHRERKVTVMPAIGYDHPDQSHFTSR